jgi:hypothetical protein
LFDIVRHEVVTHTDADLAGMSVDDLWGHIGDLQRFANRFDADRARVVLVAERRAAPTSAHWFWPATTATSSSTKPVTLPSAAPTADGHSNHHEALPRRTLSTVWRRRVCTPG